MQLNRPFLGAQYYRPPFPNSKLWRPDMEKMAETGLDVVQLWVCWGWVESTPGEFRFDDYDELMGHAADAGLGVVLSTIAEIQPFWVPREIPDATMIDNFGHEVISSPRRECNVGLTPGGCWDHGELKERMGGFLSAVAGRYAGHEALAGWDIWNETRWAVQADGYTCYCHSTLAAFRAWLLERYGDLDGINAAWRRRYTSIDDVMPGKVPARPYTDLVEFEAFLAWRASDHLAWRAGLIRAEDATHPVTAHSAFPVTLTGSLPQEQAAARGNDFDLAELVDGFGCSQFPAWQGMNPAWASGADVELGARFESGYWAAGDSEAWVSELQGGGINNGFSVFEPVEGARQARWIWSALARGMKGIIFWCWRDEVFGYESAGFGIVGDDGKAESRLASLRRSADAIGAHRELLAGYRPDRPEVGILFSEGSYELEWAQDGNSERAQASVLGWMLSCERTQLPYRIVDADHLAELDSLKLLVLPWPLVIPDATAERILAWVEAGGHLVTEAELDAYDEHGFYRYGADRPLAGALGVAHKGRRQLSEAPTIDLGSDIGSLATQTLVQAFEDFAPGVGGEILARGESGEAVALARPYGSGRVLAIGSFPGQTAGAERSRPLERLLSREVAAAGVEPTLAVTPGDGEVLQWRMGTAEDGSRLLFVLSERPHTEVTLRSASFAGAGSAAELLGGGAWKVEVTDGVATLVGRTGEDCVAVLNWRG
jgi:beta-galactosidase